MISESGQDSLIHLEDDAINQLFSDTEFKKKE